MNVQSTLLKMFVFFFVLFCISDIFLHDNVVLFLIRENMSLKLKADNSRDVHLNYRTFLLSYLLLYLLLDICDRHNVIH